MSDRLKALAILATVALFGLLAWFDYRNGMRVSPSYWVIIVAGLLLAVWGLTKKPDEHE